METAYSYEVFYPQHYHQDINRQWPLLLFLHGAGERGTDIARVKLQGLPKYLQHKHDFPFIVAYPQCPPHSYWSVPGLRAWYNALISQIRYDSAQVYLTGLSMGGYGTWHWAAADPEQFAAIIPICGGGEPSQAYKLTRLPIWAFHGAKDSIVPVEQTLEMAKAVKIAGGDVKVTIYPDLFHDSWTETYNNPEIYDWLLKHKREQ